MGSIAPASPASAAATVRLLPSRADVALVPVHIAVTLLVALLGLSAIALDLYVLEASHTPLAVASGLTVLGLLVYMRYFLGLPWLSASGAYLLLFWIFHCGMTFTAVLVPSVLDSIEEYELEWFSWPNVRLSMLLSVIGAAGFVFGVGLLQHRSFRYRPAGPIQPEPALYWCGWVTMIAGLFGTLAVLAVSGGPEIFSMTYLEFRRTVLEPTNLQSVVDFSQLGCLMVICGATDRLWKWPLILWTVTIGVPMLLLGMRGETLIPMVTFAVVLMYRGVRFRPSVLALAALVTMVVIPAVRIFRDVGFSNRSAVNWTEFTPLDTFVELGGSLRSTKAYVDWIEDGDPLLLGLSYWAPFDRQVLTRVIPGRERIEVGDDERVPLRLMDTREGAVGGSSTGEAYYNFGSVGPFLFFTFVGLLFGILERWARWTTTYGCAIMGSMMFLFFVNIRSDWLAVPSQIVLALALIGSCQVLGRLIPMRSLQP
jgi:hypothetical protein